PDDRQGLAGLDRKTDAVHGIDMRGRTPEHRAARDKAPGKILDFQQRAHDTSLSSGALMQRDQWSASTCANGGGAATQMSLTNGQRVAKRHPAGSVARFGTTPSIVARRSIR